MTWNRVAGLTWTCACEEPDCEFAFKVAVDAPHGGEEAAAILDEHTQSAHGKRFPAWRTEVGHREQ